MDEQDEIDALSDMAKNMAGRGAQRMVIDECGACPVGNFEGNCPHVETCHLTPDHQRIIKAMVRGVFDCGHCKWLGDLKQDCKPTDPTEFCSGWEERQDQGGK